MGMFNRKQPTPEQDAETLRGIADERAAVSRAARAVGADKVADATRRSAARTRVVARYLESGRCRFGHENCTAGDH